MGRKPVRRAHRVQSRCLNVRSSCRAHRHVVRRNSERSQCATAALQCALAFSRARWRAGGAGGGPTRYSAWSPEARDAGALVAFLFGRSPFNSPPPPFPPLHTHGPLLSDGPFPRQPAPASDRPPHQRNRGSPPPAPLPSILAPWPHRLRPPATTPTGAAAAAAAAAAASRSRPLAPSTGAGLGESHAMWEPAAVAMAARAAAPPATAADVASSNDDVVDAVAKEGLRAPSPPTMPGTGDGTTSVGGRGNAGSGDAAAPPTPAPPAGDTADGRREPAGVPATAV
jgi:hypothetical protein